MHTSVHTAQCGGERVVVRACALSLDLAISLELAASLDLAAISSLEVGSDDHDAWLDVSTPSVSSHSATSHEKHQRPRARIEFVTHPTVATVLYCNVLW